MSRSLPRLAAFAAAGLLLALSVVAPFATADHVYTHRYQIAGRVVDADGVPVPGVYVQMAVPNLSVEGPCNHQMPNDETEAWGDEPVALETNAYGEFFLCIHTHALAEDTNASIRVRVNETVVTTPADPYLRRTWVDVQLPDVRDVSADAAAAWAANFTLSGRAWSYTGARTIEGVPAYGMTINDAPVNVTFRPADGGAERNWTLTTNGYGDFANRLPISGDAGEGTLHVEYGNVTTTVNVSATERAADVILSPVPAPWHPVSETTIEPQASGSDDPSDDEGTGDADDDTANNDADGDDADPTGGDGDGATDDDDASDQAEGDAQAPGPGVLVALVALAFAGCRTRRR